MMRNDFTSELHNQAIKYGKYTKIDKWVLIIKSYMMHTLFLVLWFKGRSDLEITLPSENG